MTRVLTGFLTGAFLATGLLRPVTALADCGLGLSAANVNLVWTTALGTQQISFSVTKTKNPRCDYFVTFSKGGATTYANRRMTFGANVLSYQLYKDSPLTKILKELPDATSTNDVISGSFATGANQAQPQSYHLDIPFNLATTPTLKPSGSYTDVYVLKVYEGEFGTTTSVVASANVTLTTSMPKKVELSLVSTGGAFDPNDTTQAVDFGTLSAGAVRALDMLVRSNAGFSITFSSQNNGVLKHASPGVTTTVPYTLAVNSVPQNLGSSSAAPVVVATGSGQSTLAGVVNPVQLTIGSVTDKMAGNYFDNITVTAATIE